MLLSSKFGRCLWCALLLQMARFDFSYPDQEMHQQGLDNLRKASKATRTLCATVMDTLGPEIVVVNR